MSAIAWEHRQLRGAPLAPAGELILDSGGGRLPTFDETLLLNMSDRHSQRPATALPYRYQDTYGRELGTLPQRVAVLSNEHLRAEFLLDLGGRLWSLCDLSTGRELLHQPDAIRMSNLAVRNAWFPGGVEWNLGTTGHWGLTCEPVCAASVGGDVLRMWAHERILGITWRLDAWLPNGADTLYTHALIQNPTAQDKPVYWWSNIAVPQTHDTRVLVDATSAYHFGYAHQLSEVPVPIRDGVDVSFPQRHPGCADYFYRVSGTHPWIAAVDGCGHGLGQASTATLTGRKLFTWGNGDGGHVWQRWLSGEGAYAEIQAGLAATQVEHLRLPPGASWRFTESYRPISITPGRPYPDAVRAAQAATVSRDALDAAHEHLTSLEQMPVDDNGEFRGGNAAQGWGALEVAVGHMPPDPATPYAADLLDEEQTAWLDLCRTGCTSSKLQGSAMVDPSWHRPIEQAQEGWLRALLLGHLEHASGDTELARRHWRASAAAHPTPDAWRALGLTTEDPEQSVQALLRAHELDPKRPRIAIEVLAALIAAGHPQQALTLVNRLPRAVRGLPRVAYWECLTLVRTGHLDRAAALLASPLLLPDLREGDLGLSDLWEEFQSARGTHEPLPAHYDFRMASEDAPWT